MRKRGQTPAGCPLTSVHTSKQMNRCELGKKLQFFEKVILAKTKKIELKIMGTKLLPTSGLFSQPEVWRWGGYGITSKGDATGASERKALIRVYKVYIKGFVSKYYSTIASDLSISIPLSIFHFYLAVLSRNTLDQGKSENREAEGPQREILDFLAQFLAGWGVLECFIRKSSSRYFVARDQAVAEAAMTSPSLPSTRKKSHCSANPRLWR